MPLTTPAPSATGALAARPSPLAPPTPARLVVVNFHYVRPRFDAPHPGVHGCTPVELASQLETLGAVGTFVSLGELLAAAAGHAALPPRAILVTFDDGLREQAEHALPVLDRLGVPAAFFVQTLALERPRVAAVHKLHLLRAHVPPARLRAALASAAEAAGRPEVARLLGGAADDAEAAAARQQYRYDPPESARLKFVLNFRLDPAERDALLDACFARLAEQDEAALAAALYLDADQLRLLAARGWLGAHGHAHLPLATLRASAARADIERSLDLLARCTGRRPRAFSYPYGSRHACSPAVATLARRAGIAVAFTMERAANVGLARPRLLARLDANDAPGGRAPLCDADALFTALPPSSWWTATPRT